MEIKEVILTNVEKAEFDGKEYRKITTVDGQTYNIKDGREGCLRRKWLLLEECIGKPIKLTLDLYKGKQYVAGLELPIGKSAMKNSPPVQDRQDSIETQCAAKIISELWGSSKLPDDDTLVTKLREWLNNKINKAL